MKRRQLLQAACATPVALALPQIRDIPLHTLCRSLDGHLCLRVEVGGKTHRFRTPRKVGWEFFMNAQKYFTYDKSKRMVTGPNVKLGDHYWVFVPEGEAHYVCSFKKVENFNG